MIPKIIHYCWFGNGTYPQEFETYRKTWKAFCPDFEVIEWNESNFDVSCNAYVREAYEARKWAFVSDYVRLWALYQYGGIYMDTDVELIRPIDAFLSNQAFSGFEAFGTVMQSGIMGGEAHHPFYKDLLAEYEKRQFNLGHGKFNLTANVVYITKYFEAKGLKLDNTRQNIDGFIVYPSEYFCPKNTRTLKLACTDNTYAIHHFAASWIPLQTRLRRVIKKLLGPTLMEYVIKFVDKFGLMGGAKPLNNNGLRPKFQTFLPSSLAAIFSASFWKTRSQNNFFCSPERALFAATGSAI